MAVLYNHVGRNTAHDSYYTTHYCDGIRTIVASQYLYTRMRGKTLEIERQHNTLTKWMTVSVIETNNLLPHGSHLTYQYQRPEHNRGSNRQHGLGGKQMPEYKRTANGVDENHTAHSLNNIKRNCFFVPL